jgi:Flp pilus assembly protein TadD
MILDSRGYAHFRFGSFDKAIADFDAALKLNPRMADTLFERGVAKRRQGDTAGGDADIASAKQIKAGVAGDMAKIGVEP